MFGSNRAGLVDSICDPAHQRPPANSRGSRAMGSAGLPASRYHRLTSVWRSGPNGSVAATIRATPLGPSGMGPSLGPAEDGLGTGRVLTVTPFSVSCKAKACSIWQACSVYLTGQVIVRGGAR
jgi:hypothetical protein